MFGDAWQQELKVHSAADGGGEKMKIAKIPMQNKTDQADFNPWQSLTSWLIILFLREPSAK